MMTDFLFLRVQNLENTVCIFGVTADAELWQVCGLMFTSLVTQP